jgi:hypothetical protein
MTRGLVSLRDLLSDPAFLDSMIQREPERDTNPDNAHLTYAELEARDERLVTLRRRVEAVRRPAIGRFCAHAHWYGRRDSGFKGELCGIVGWDSANPDAALRTTEAYDVAYHHLYDLLPDCRHDGMCG